MKKILFLLVFVLIHITSYSQFTLSGTVSTPANTTAVTGTTIVLDHTFRITYCDKDGHFTLPGLAAGKHLITLTNISFTAKSFSIQLVSDTSISVVLDPAVILADEVIIAAIHADNKTPVAFSELSKTAIDGLNFGKDIPYILNLLPAVVTTSDAGNSIGYTGIRIRGSDASRINVTVNGVPVNDAESQNVYWVDLPDLATSVENIQVQRGAGTSTNGAGAFGGSINLQTNKINPLPYAESGFSAGSFRTLKNNVAMGTGLLHDHWFMEGRLSKITSDGYIDRSKANLKSFYVSGGYAGKNTIARFNIFSGKEITYQSWNGVPESRMRNDKQGMQAFIDRNYLSNAEAENLLNSGRTYNFNTYKNQVDDYQQDHYQLLLSHQFTPAFLFNTALHYTKGNGYFEEYLKNDSLSFYGLAPVLGVTDTIVTSDLIRRKWLKNNFYGITYSLHYNPDSRNKLILGGAWNQYDGDHFNELTWMQWTSGSHINQRYLQDHALKNDFNVFIKYIFDLTENINIYIDQQYRKVSYHFNGIAADGSLSPLKDELDFFNPKAGLYIKLNPHHSVFASVGIAQKEPSRDDYTNNSFIERPSSEKMTDYESGYRFKSTNTSIQFNAYVMDYKNQLVLRGDLNDVGNATRMNIKKSSRMGIEISGEHQLIRTLNIYGNITLSRNKIKSFTNQLDNYYDGSKTTFIMNDKDIAFSPGVTGMGRMEFLPLKNLSFTISGKYTGKQYLDNTQNETRKINDYTVFDVITQYKIHYPWLNEVTFGILLNNVLNTRYASNGYTYGYFYGASEVHENFYYPQAGFNALGRVNIKF